MYISGYKHGTYSVNLDGAEEAEVNELVALFRGMGFTKSAQVSRYIRNHQLGYKFQHISGYLELTRYEDGITDTWEFEGGIKPIFYKAICERLGLDNEHSDAKVTDFESYRDRWNGRRVQR